MDKKDIWGEVKFCVGLLIGILATYLLCKWTFQQEVDKVKQNYQSLEQKRDSLLNELKEHDAEILVLEDSLKKKEEKIVYIRIKGYEKMDSVQHLPLDEAMDFFSKSLSSEIGY